jgi:hypothetical protein
MSDEVRLARLKELEEDATEARLIHEAAATAGDVLTAAEAAEREREAIAALDRLLGEHPSCGDGWDA